MDTATKRTALQELAHEACQTAKEHGWHDVPDGVTMGMQFATAIALIHSEASEALEAYRKGRPEEEVATELADVLIRVLDMCGYMNLPIGEAVTKKMEVNRSRPFRHGGLPF